MTGNNGGRSLAHLFESRPHKFRAPKCREFIPVTDPPEFRARVEHAIDSLIALLDSIDAPREDYEGGGAEL